MPTSVISPSNLTLNVNITIPSLVPQSFGNSEVTCNHTYTEVLKTYAAGGLINCKVTCESREYPAVFALQYDSPAFIFQSLDIKISGTDPALDGHITYALVMGLNSWYLINIHPNILQIQNVSGENILRCTFDHLYNHAINSRDILAVQYFSSIFFLSYCDTNAIKFNYIPAGDFLDQQQIVFTPQNVTNDSSYVIADVQNYSSIPDTAYFTYTVSQDDTNSSVLSLSDNVKNKLSGIVNPNLLDNWYFGNPVNQRDVSGTISSAGYFLDRWKLVSGSVTISADGITLNGTMQQVLETAPVGTVTVSALTQAGVGEVVPTYDSANKTVTVTAAGKKLVAVKLELGTEQTLAHQENGVWVLNEIPDYGAELTKCMRYLQIISTPYDTSGNGVAIGYANNSIDLWVPIPLAVPMRISPTPAIPTGGASLFKVGKTSNAPKDVTKVKGGWAMQTGGACSMRSLIFMSSGLTAGETYILFMKKGAQIVLSAEL